MNSLPHSSTTQSGRADRDTVTGAEILGERECWELLRSVDLGRLAMYANGEVDIFPVNFAVDAMSLVFRSAPGTKMVEVILAGGCAFEIDGYDEGSHQAWSVVVKGWCQKLDKQADVDAARALALVPWNSAHKDLFVRIVPREVTGRRFLVADGSAPVARSSAPGGSKGAEIEE